MLTNRYLYILVVLLTSFSSGCKTKPLVEKEEGTPHHPNNTDTYWAKGTAAADITAKLNLTSGVIEFTGKEGKKGFTKSMPFGQIQPGLYRFSSVANEELVYQSGENSITMSFSSPAASLYLPLEGYRIMESMQPVLEVQTGNLPGVTTAAEVTASAEGNSTAAAPLATPTISEAGPMTAQGTNSTITNPSLPSSTPAVVTPLNQTPNIPANR